MYMKKLFKYLIMIPLYIFLVLEGFIGGASNTKDIWDDLIKWVNK